MKIAPGIVLLVSVLTLIVAPVTCSGGLLVHCCTPEAADHEDDHHEHTCPADPCNRSTLLVAAKSVDDDDSRDDGTDLPFLPADLDRSDGNGSTGRPDDASLLAASAVVTRSLPLLC